MPHDGILRFVTVVKPNWTRAEIDTKPADVGSSAWPWDEHWEKKDELWTMSDEEIRQPYSEY